MAELSAWLLTQPNGRGATPSDQSIRRVLAPCVRRRPRPAPSGLIQQDPTADAHLPHRPQIEDEDEPAKPFNDEQLRAFRAVVHPRHRLMMAFTAVTGLRVSEVLGAEVRDLHLSGDRPHVKVRQRWRKGALGPPKSKHGRRDVPLPHSMVGELRAHVRGRAAAAPLWPSRVGTRLSAENVLSRYVKPAAERSTARGRAGTRCATRARQCRSRAGATSSRSSAGWATTRRASRSTPTSTFCQAI